jgi:UDP-GlcNAc:undecaprenyl-phosphate GlcNAc-1-phosphate transferase
MWKLFIPLSLAVSLLLVFLILMISHKKAWYDGKDERKLHSGQIPRLGGIGFALTFIGAAAVVTLNAPEKYLGVRALPLLAAMLLITICGLIDDFHCLAARYKLLCQAAAALAVVIPGYSFQQLFGFGPGPLNGLNWLNRGLSFLWIVGLINAVNLVDGVDGLAGGLAALIALSYGLIFASFSNTGSVTLLCLCLCAAVGGFLVFNLPRAKIFMGDGGSQFLGLTLAFLPLIDKGNTRSDLPLLHAAALLLIPILDTLAAIIRRIKSGRRIHDPDRDHIHHKLMYLGLGPWGVNGVLFTLQGLLSLLVFLSVKAEGSLSPIALGAAYLAGPAFFITVYQLSRKRGAAAA